MNEMLIFNQPLDILCLIKLMGTHLYCSQNQCGLAVFL